MNNIEISQKFDLKEKPSVVLTCSNLKTEVTQSDSDICEINVYLEINEENNFTADRLIESEYSEEANELSLKIPAPGLKLRKYKGRVEASVPHGTKLDVNTSNGSIRVTDLTAEVAVNTSNGSVFAETVFGNVKANTLNGSITLNKVNGNITTEVLNGGTKIENSVSSINSKSMNGSINISDTVFSDADISNKNGRITVVITEECSGKVNCANQNGRIHVAIPEEQTFKLTAVNKHGGIKNKLPDHCTIEKKVGKSKLECIRSGSEAAENLNINVENMNGSILLTDDLNTDKDSRTKIKFEDIDLDINLDGISDFVNKTVNTAVNEVNKLKSRFNIDIENFHIPDEKMGKIEKKIKKVVRKMKKKIGDSVDEFCDDADDEEVHDIIVDIEHEIDDELLDAREEAREAIQDAKEDIAEAEADIREAIEEIKEAEKVVRVELRNLDIPEDTLDALRIKLDKKKDMLRDKLHDVKRIVRKKEMLNRTHERGFGSIKEPDEAFTEYQDKSRKNTSSVKMQILRLLEDGKISVDEADRLLKSV